MAYDLYRDTKDIKISIITQKMANTVSEPVKFEKLYDFSDV